MPYGLRKCLIDVNHFVFFGHKIVLHKYHYLLMRLGKNAS
ncbi:Uncharacterised protein [Salmonella enterica subsp. salamae]|nr:Uncharacterised protein [Salmonella enterica subsp. salamae]